MALATGEAQPWGAHMDGRVPLCDLVFEGSFATATNTG